MSAEDEAAAWWHSKRARPPGLLVVSYGGGVDSVASLVYLHRIGEPPPAAIVMADPGSEKAPTWAYVREWMNPRLRKWGWPELTVISRKQEGLLRAQQKGRGRRFETLYEECMRIKALPSIAYGPKKCSQKYKGEPQRWWADRQPWAHAEWAAGRKLVKAIGYDFDEPKRVQRSVTVMTPPPLRPEGHVGPWPRDRHKWERDRFDLWFPVFEARLTRAMCEELIQSERMPVPPKSSCTFCPNNTLEEWIGLRENDPDVFAAAVEMSRNAVDNIDNTDDVGLMRCNRSGSRQLHEWADGKYSKVGGGEVAIACECAT